MTEGVGALAVAETALETPELVAVVAEVRDAEVTLGSAEVAVGVKVLAASVTVVAAAKVPAKMVAMVAMVEHVAAVTRER